MVTNPIYYSSTSSENRLIGAPPKIGIRPIIDGRRRGIRETLEAPTLALAHAAANLITQNLRHGNSRPVECVVPDFCIGGVAESAQVAELFARSGVGVSITLTPCWAYGSETMDMDPLTPKAVWGFNGTERPGAVYLAAVLAAHNQKGLPAFGIYGHDVQEAGSTDIPEDVQEKLLRFARAGLAVASMRGKSYLAMGGVSMGISGSIVDQPFFEKYLGMRVESVDMSEFFRRIEERIYDQEELQRALSWVKQYCQEGWDKNPPEKQHSRAAERPGLGVCGEDGAGRPRLDGRQPQAEQPGLWRRSHGPQRHRRRFSRAAPVDRPFSKRRFHGVHPEHLLRLERDPRSRSSWPPRMMRSTAPPCSSATC